MPNITGIWLPIIVSAIALVFTIFSFWWMNWRPGKLNVGNLRLFAAGKATEGSESNNVIVIALPLTLWNSGARPIVIEDLKLTPVDIPHMTELLFERVDNPLTTSILEPNTKIESDYFYLPVALNANEIIQRNFVFEAKSTDFTFTAIKYHFWLRARFTRRSRWRKMKMIEISFSHLNDVELFNLNELYSVFHYRVEGEH